VAIADVFNVGLNHYLVLSALIFTIGLYGALSRRNAVAILMAIELMLNSVNISFVAFSTYLTPEFIAGQIFALFVICVAAAEAAIGLAIILTIYRNRASVDVEQVDILKW
jgi:NADH:ubiquinone oxidoreductase subunit K